MISTLNKGYLSVHECQKERWEKRECLTTFTKYSTFWIEANAHPGHQTKVTVPLREGEQQRSHHPRKFMFFKLSSSLYFVSLLLEQHWQSRLVDNPVGSKDRYDHHASILDIDLDIDEQGSCFVVCQPLFWPQRWRFQDA